MLTVWLRVGASRPRHLVFVSLRRVNDSDLLESISGLIYHRLLTPSTLISNSGPRSIRSTETQTNMFPLGPRLDSAPSEPNHTKTIHLYRFYKHKSSASCSALMYINKKPWSERDKYINPNEQPAQICWHVLPYLPLACKETCGLICNSNEWMDGAKWEEEEVGDVGLQAGLTHFPYQLQFSPVRLTDRVHLVRVRGI